MTELEFKRSAFKAYQSSYRVLAQQLHFKTIGEGEELDLGGDLVGTNGDYLVEHPDGRREFMSPEQFEREYELERRSAKLKEV